MKQLIKKCVQGIARLAFWRKPVSGVQEAPPPVSAEPPVPAPDPESLRPDNEPAVPEMALPPLAPDVPAPDPAIPDWPGADAMGADLLEPAEDFAPAEPAVAAEVAPGLPDAPPAPVAAVPDRMPLLQGQAVPDTPPELTSGKPSLLERLKRLFRRRSVADGAAASGLPDDPRSVQPAAADASTEGVSSKPSLLERLKNVFRRKSGADTGHDAETGVTEEADSTADGEVPEGGCLRRVLAWMSNRRVWIPGAGIILLVPLVVMALMLRESAQEKARLQMELQAAQQKLKQVSPGNKAGSGLAAKKQADGRLEPGENSMPVLADGGMEGMSGDDAGDCVVTDQASVIQNLRNCIEDFNRSTGR